MIRYPRITWGDGIITLKIQVDGTDRECIISRNLAYALLLDLVRALAFGEARND